ncbi:MAG TPA: DNA ligase D [Pseudomonadales bacterium]
MARLNRYRDKRNFRKTPEPSGRIVRRPAGEGGLFVVHKHAARRLHYDLRLEHDGVLESWAVPKGPGREPGDKRLAVHVEDHPLDYGEFEGVIPKGEYGGGTMMLWDRGHWRQTRRSNGRIDFELEGHKLKGAWTLTRMAKRGDDKEADNWLLIKRHDPEGFVDMPADVPEDVSVASGRTMEEIAEAGENRAPGAAAMPGARRGRLPARPRPQLATLVDRPPSGAGWIHEIKFDGYRIMAVIDRGEVRLVSRNGKDWTERFPEIARELAKLPADAAVLDGEIVALQADGTSSFRGLQEALSDKRTGELVYQVFDLVHLDGTDLTGVELTRRKAALAELSERAGFVGSARIRHTEHIDGAGAEFYDQACRLGLEGIVCKRADARYRGERNRQWLKVKCSRHAELLIGGFTDPSGSRTGFGALLLGAWDEDGRLQYAGKVGTGFDQRQLAALARELKRREIDRSPFVACPERGGVHWVQPELVAEVEFTEQTRDGYLRHPAFRGLREDKNPEDIRMAEPDPTVTAQKPAGAATAERSSRRTRSRTKPRAGSPGDGRVRVAGVVLTNPDRVLYPQQGITKLDLARYYEDVADWILPRLRRRPLSLVRCPEGQTGQCFYQKHPGQAIPADLPRTSIREKEGKADYLYVDDLRDLIGLVQAGTLELHVWGSRVEDHERPDTLVFDLDPGSGVAWPTMLEVARALRERLRDLDLEGFVRTTGGKGLHVVVPIEPRLGWDEVKAFTRAVAEAHARDDRRLTVNMSKSKRGGKIFLDYLRNGRGATAIASYSTRARPNAPVAVPVRWEELGPALVSDRYNVGNLRRRLAALKADPWAEFDAARRPLTRRTLNAVGAAKRGAKR